MASSLVQLEKPSIGTKMTSSLFASCGLFNFRANIRKIRASFPSTKQILRLLAIRANVRLWLDPKMSNAC